MNEINEFSIVCLAPTESVSEQAAVI